MKLNYFSVIITLFVLKMSIVCLSPSRKVDIENVTMLRS